MITCQHARDRHGSAPQFVRRPPAGPRGIGLCFRAGICVSARGPRPRERRRRAKAIWTVLRSARRGLLHRGGCGCGCGCGSIHGLWMMNYELRFMVHGSWSMNYGSWLACGRGCMRDGCTSHLRSGWATAIQVRNRNSNSNSSLRLNSRLERGPTRAARIGRNAGPCSISCAWPGPCSRVPCQQK